MNRIWANRLEGGTQDWSGCPDSRKAAVRELLLQDVRNGRNGMTPERYTEITGEEYPEA